MAQAETQEREAVPKDEIAEVKRLNVDGYVNAVAWSVDGKKLAVLSNFGSRICAYSANNWENISNFSRNGGAYSGNSFGFIYNDDVITSISVTEKVPDDLFFNTNSGKEKIKSLDIFSNTQWNLKTGNRVQYIPDFIKIDLSNPPPSVNGNTYSVSKDGTLIAGVSGRTRIFLYDLMSRAINNSDVSQDLESNIFFNSIGLSPDNNLIAVGDLSGKVYLFSTLDLRMAGFVKLPESEWYRASSLSFNSQSNLLFIGNVKSFDYQRINNSLEHKDDGVIGGYIYDIINKKIILSLKGSVFEKDGINRLSHVNSSSWSEKYNILAVGDGISLKIWDIKTDSAELLANRYLKGGSYSVAFSPNGEIATGGAGEVIVYKLQHNNGNQ